MIKNTQNEQINLTHAIKIKTIIAMQKPVSKLESKLWKFIYDKKNARKS